MRPRLRIPVALKPSSSFRGAKPIAPYCRKYATRPPSKKGAGKKDQKDKRKKGRGEFIQHDLKDAQQFSLVEAMRYIQAMEVGRVPTSVKYDLAVKLRTPKTSPIIRNNIQFPTPVRTDKRVCVIATGKHAEAARQAGAAIVGTDEVFEQIREGKMDFDLCIAQEDSLQALNKSGVARILGPRGLMPSTKLGTVVKNPAPAIRDLIGKSDYRERLGVVRLAVGQLGFTRSQLEENIKAFMKNLRKDIADLRDVTKSIHEVVLSSTNSSGFSLNGRIEPKAAGEGAGIGQSTIGI